MRLLNSLTKTCWLLDADLFAAYRDRLIAGCSYRETFPKEACVIAHGDIELVTRIHREQPG